MNVVSVGGVPSASRFTPIPAKINDIKTEPRAPRRGGYELLSADSLAYLTVCRGDSRIARLSRVQREMSRLAVTEGLRPARVISPHPPPAASPYPRGGRLADGQWPPLQFQ